MTFLNKKEQVIDIELTSWGRRLLAQGDFEPVYYAFFDDDILYDASGSAGAGETQNQIEGRIQDNTPSLKAQYLFEGVETNVNAIVASNRALAALSEDYRDQEVAIFPPLLESDFSLIEPLGSMELGSENSPSWDIRVLKGELTGAINHLTSSAAGGGNSEVRRIPQLDFELNYKVAVSNIEDRPPEQVLDGPYSDGTYLYLTEGMPELIFSVDEKNASSDTEYDIEVFEVTNDGKKDLLIPVVFAQKVPEVVDGFLLSREERASILRDESPATADMVSYYFNIDTDLEIPEEQMCQLIANLRTRGVEVEDIPYDCPEVLPVGRINIYDTDATGGEEC